MAEATGRWWAGVGPGWVRGRDNKGRVGRRQVWILAEIVGNWVTEGKLGVWQGITGGLGGRQGGRVAEIIAGWWGRRQWGRVAETTTGRVTESTEEW